MNTIQEYEKYYVIDFFNIFSDYREIIYKKKDIDFHSVKHENKEKDTYDFFHLFFTKYVKKVNINKSNSTFIFVMKKIHNYENILNKIILFYSGIKIHFFLIENEFRNKILDKNKDDFVCQYIFFTLFHKYKNCILISNDKYRDKLEYINMFNSSIDIKIIKISKVPDTPFVQMQTQINIENKLSNLYISNLNLSLDINKNIIKMMEKQNCVRCTIPKHKLHTIL